MPTDEPADHSRRPHRLRAYAAILLATPILLSACSGAADKAQPAAPPAADVGVELRTAQPSYPAGTPPALTLVLRNNASGACKLPSRALGAVEVVSVRRDGAAVIGRSGREYFYDGLTQVVAGNLREVQPGGTVDLPLDVETLPNRPPTLVVSQQTASDDGRTTSWALDQPGRYRVTARLSSVAGLPETCGFSGAPATVEFEVR